MEPFTRRQLTKQFIVVGLGAAVAILLFGSFGWAINAAIGIGVLSVLFLLLGGIEYLREDFDARLPYWALVISIALMVGGALGSLLAKLLFG